MFSVLLVTAGVITTTLSVPERTSRTIQDDSSHTPVKPYTYTVGVSILALALFLSGLLGLVQDWTFSRYGRPTTSNHNDRKASNDTNGMKRPPAWQESMFYLHFLALPMFLSVRHHLASQFRSINAGPALHLFFPASSPLDAYTSIPETWGISLSFPKAYVPLVLNTLTQLLCVAGVHRLTTRVSALTVTLVLVVRKAASFIISVLWLAGAARNDDNLANADGLRKMWFGAGLVLVGTIGYSLGSGTKAKKWDTSRDAEQYERTQEQKITKIE